MAELGQTGDATELVPGSPEEIEEFAAALRALARDGLRPLAQGLDDGCATSTGWQGEAATTFRSSAAVMRQEAMHLAGALHGAAWLAERYAAQLRWAQSEAAWAISVDGQGRMLAASGQLQGGQWVALAQSRLSAARGRVQVVARVLAEALEALARAIPELPSLTGAPSWYVSELGRGVIDLVTGLVTGALSLSSWHYLVDPQGYQQDVDLAVAGLAEQYGSLDAAVSTLTDQETWRESPARALGHLAPLLAGPVFRVGETGTATGTAEAALPVVIEGETVVRASTRTTSAEAVSYRDLVRDEPPPTLSNPLETATLDEMDGVRTYANDYGAPPSGITMMRREDGTVVYSVLAEKGITPTGTQMFREAWAHFPDAQGISATWATNMPSNLAAFNAALRAGIPPEQAVWLTFSGKMAAEVGMQEVTILNRSGKVGRHTMVELDYSRGSAP